MPYVTVGKENSGNIELYYEDHGSGQPVVLIHGYPLSGASWEKQVPALLKAGYRVITYDRRGFGKSTQPTEGYKLRHVRRGPAQTDHAPEAAGFHTGRLLDGRRRDRALHREVRLQGSEQGGDHGRVPPFLLKTNDNPEGVDASVFEGIKKAVADGPLCVFHRVFQNFYNTDQLLGKRVSEEVVRASWNIAAGSSATASLACVPTWHEDFRKDLDRVDVPTLVIHGDEDRIVPITAAGARTAKTHQGRAPARRERRAALHHLDARGRSQRATVELPGRKGAGEQENRLRGLGL